MAPPEWIFFGRTGLSFGRKKWLAPPQKCPKDAYDWDCLQDNLKISESKADQDQGIIHVFSRKYFNSWHPPYSIPWPSLLKLVKTNSKCWMDLTFISTQSFLAARKLCTDYSLCKEWRFSVYCFHQYKCFIISILSTLIHIYCLQYITLIENDDEYITHNTV